MKPSLHRALGPWADALALFGPDLWRGIGPWLGPLETVIGRRDASRSRDGELDGVAGIARRGSYERLLPSEWLLAEELPDEFLRRAASDEHLFVELARAEPHARGAIVALFDAGPFQLGAPRLAHLALLVVFARRAADRAAILHFAALQGEAIWTLSTQGARGLLEARTARPANRADLDRWRLRLQSDGLGDAETWLVGDGEPTHDGWRTARVVDCGASLEVTVDERQAILALPSEALGARILRHPFPSPPTRRRLETGDSYDPTLVLAPDGRRLFLRTGEDVIAMHVPRAAENVPGNDRRAPARPGEPVVGVTTAGRKLIWLGFDGARLWLRDAGGAALSMASDERLALGPDGPKLLHFAIDRYARGRSRAGAKHVRRAWLRDVADRLWRIDVSDEGDASLHLVVEKALAFVSRHGEIAYAYRVDGSTLRVVSSVAGVQQLRDTTSAGVRLAFGIARGPLVHGLQRGDRCIVEQGASRYELATAPGRAVLGIVGFAPPRLLLVDQARRSVVMVDHQGVLEPFLELSRPAVALAWSSSCLRLAYRTEAGEIGVYDLERRERVLRAEVVP